MNITSEQPPTGPFARIVLSPTEVVRLRHILWLKEGQECDCVGDDGGSLYTRLAEAGFRSTSWRAEEDEVTGGPESVGERIRAALAGEPIAGGELTGSPSGDGTLRLQQYRGNARWQYRDDFGLTQVLVPLSVEEAIRAPLEAALAEVERRKRTWQEWTYVQIHRAEEAEAALAEARRALVEEAGDATSG